MIKLTRRRFNGMIGTALLAETFAAGVAQPESIGDG